MERCAGKNLAGDNPQLFKRRLLNSTVYFIRTNMARHEKCEEYST